MALGLIEVYGFTTAIVVADAVAKSAEVKIVALDNNKPSPEVLKTVSVPLVMVVKFEGDVAAVEQAVDTCIKNGILEDFLRKNRAEAIEMSIFEYDEEKHLTSEREIWRQEGESRLAKLLELMLQENKKDNVEKALADAEYREKLYKEYHL